MKYNLTPQPGNKHIIEIFKKDLQQLLKYGATTNNIKEFYHSCNSLGHAINPHSKDLESWIEEILNEKLS